MTLNQHQKGGARWEGPSGKPGAVLFGLLPTPVFSLVIVAQKGRAHVLVGDESWGAGCC